MFYKKLLFLVLAIVVFLPGAGVSDESNEVLSETNYSGEHWLAGVSAVDITPQGEHLKDDDLFMGGYGIGSGRGAAEGIRSKVWTRSLALSDGNTTILFTVLDLPGISCSDLTAIKKEVGETTGFDPQNMMITVTHTHSGPDLQGLWGGVPSSYREYVRSKTVKSATKALKNIEPVKLFFGKADYEEGVVNRRGYDEIDSSLYLLHAVSPLHEPVATMAVFGAHTTFLGEENKMISADFSGKLVKNLENEMGGTALFAPGIQGDQTPEKGNMDIYAYALNLTDTALEAFNHAEEIPLSSLQYERQEFPLNVRNPVFVLAYLIRYLSHYEVDFSFRHGLHINTGASYLTLGNKLSVATVPGEILNKPGTEIRDMSSASETMVIGLTNGTLGYIVHEDQWDGGIPFLNRGYEESVSMGKHVWPAIRDNLQNIMD